MLRHKHVFNASTARGYSAVSTGTASAAPSRRTLQSRSRGAAGHARGQHTGMGVRTAPGYAATGTAALPASLLGTKGRQEDAGHGTRPVPPRTDTQRSPSPVAAPLPLPRGPLCSTKSEKPTEEAAF